MNNSIKYSTIFFILIVLLIPFKSKAEDEWTYKYLYSNPRYKVFVNYHHLKINSDSKKGTVYTIPVIIEYTVLQEDGTRQFHTKFEYTKDWKYCRLNSYWYEDDKRRALSFDSKYIGDWELIDNGTVADEIRIRMQKYF